jgi:hypothetical protein
MSILRLPQILHDQSKLVAFELNLIVDLKEKDTIKRAVMLPGEDDDFPINSIGSYRGSLRGHSRSGCFRCCRCTKIDVLIAMLSINIILTLTIIASGSWFFGPANEMVNFYTQNREQMNSTIHKVTRMLNEADDILRMVRDFKSFVTDKVMGALCQSSVTRTVIGRFCVEPNLQYPDNGTLQLGNSSEKRTTGLLSITIEELVLLWSALEKLKTDSEER